MSTVGIFAGRGDIVLAMALAFFVGILVGWQLRKGSVWFQEKITSRFSKKDRNENN